MSNYTTDNRWSPGSSGADVPETAPAVYSARWIDQGDDVMADVLHDRQGFAYNDKADYERLITLMGEAGDALRLPHGMGYDETSVEVRDGWHFASRRAGGYIYVDAWLTPVTDNPPAVDIVATELQPGDEGWEPFPS